MNAYADYEYYTTEYSGSTVLESDFTRLINKASAYLDRITFGRIEAPTDEVRRAACEIAECIDQYADTDGISQQTVGSLTEVYAPGTTSKPKSLEERQYEIARNYLANTGLLYRGVSR
jgi:hypothetical protein